MKTRAAEPHAGIQEPVSDAPVHSHGPEDFADIGFGLCAQDEGAIFFACGEGYVSSNLRSAWGTGHGSESQVDLLALPAMSAIQPAEFLVFQERRTPDHLSKADIFGSSPMPQQKNPHMKWGILLLDRPLSGVALHRYGR